MTTTGSNVCSFCQARQTMVARRSHLGKECQGSSVQVHVRQVQRSQGRQKQLREQHHLRPRGPFHRILQPSPHYLRHSTMLVMDVQVRLNTPAAMADSRPMSTAEKYDIDPQLVMSCA